MARVKEISNEVLIAEDPIVQVDRAQLDDLKSRAARSPRHRARLCAHKADGDPLHEMLIVLSRSVYIRPHKHLHKTESFHVIEGRALVLFFDETGQLEEVLHIGDSTSGRPFYFRNDDPRYHTQLITTDYLVFHETTNGPFNRADTVYAPWSPGEQDAVAVAAYKERLYRDAEAFT